MSTGRVNPRKQSHRWSEVSAASPDLCGNEEMLSRSVDLDGLRVLDVGCGAGRLVRHLVEQGADATGIECGEAMLERAIDADPTQADRFVAGVGQDLPFDDASFDLVTFFYSLHHVPHEFMGAALAEAARVLRPQGLIWVLEPVPSGPGFETFRVVDDETEVRTRAQEALDAFSASAVCDELAMLSYDTEYRYVDFEECKADVIGIDSDRAVTVAEVEDEFERRFLANGDRRSDGWWFRQPVLARRFALV